MEVKSHDSIFSMDKTHNYHYLRSAHSWIRLDKKWRPSRDRVIFVMRSNRTKKIPARRSNILVRMFRCFFRKNKVYPITRSFTP